MKTRLLRRLFARIRKRMNRRFFICAGASLVMLCILLSIVFHAALLLFPFPEQRLQSAVYRGTAVMVLDNRGEILRAYTGSDDMWMFHAGRDSISERVVQATIAAEDKRFYSHHGVDLLAICRAAASNLLNMRAVSGASTITMQTIRLLDNRPRTLASKLAESFRAVQLERFHTKDEILEYYLNLAPYGGNIVGIEAASLAYFRKRPADLTLAEAALLAGLPQSPSRLRPDRHPERARKRRDVVLNRMHACGFINDTELRRALSEPVAIRREPFPFQAPHFAEMVRRTHPSRAILRTTLELGIQQLCEETLIAAVESHRNDGVSNGSIVVIENYSGAVRAVAGSVDFHSLEHSGQVNGAVARRSPGSALKPFLYAQSFDRGIITPSSMLSDEPLNRSGYSPRNYDRRYRGPVSAEAALALSLNVPAVQLLEELGHESFYELLLKLGFTTLDRPASHYGLGIVLGSAEVSLIELTNAYATLARMGVHRPWCLLENQPEKMSGGNVAGHCPRPPAGQGRCLAPTESESPGRRIFSPEAAWLTAQVLSNPEFHTGLAVEHRRAPGGGQGIRMAFKTGTSWGHRDAWTVAFTPKYTVGVWMGNFSGEPGRGLVGIQAAAPVAVEIIKRLHSQGLRCWFEMPSRIAVRRVCPVSGMIHGRHCGSYIEGYVICGRSSMQECSVHRGGGEHDAEQALAASLAGGRRDPPTPNSFGRASPPLYCNGVPGHSSVAPEVLSPTKGRTYVIDPTLVSQRLPFRASASTPRVHWFVNGELYSSTSAGNAIFWDVTIGDHTITCSDDTGRCTSLSIHVR